MNFNTEWANKTIHHLQSMASRDPDQEAEQMPKGDLQAIGRKDSLTPPFAEVNSTPTPKTNTQLLLKSLHASPCMSSATHKHYLGYV